MVARKVVIGFAAAVNMGIYGHVDEPNQPTETTWDTELAARNRYRFIATSFLTIKAQSPLPCDNFQGFADSIADDAARRIFRGNTTDKDKSVPAGSERDGEAGETQAGGEEAAYESIVLWARTTNKLENDFEESLIDAVQAGREAVIEVSREYHKGLDKIGFTLLEEENNSKWILHVIKEQSQNAKIAAELAGLERIRNAIAERLYKTKFNSEGRDPVHRLLIRVPSVSSAVEFEVKSRSGGGTLRGFLQEFVDSPLTPYLKPENTQIHKPRTWLDARKRFGEARAKRGELVQKAKQMSPDAPFTIDIKDRIHGDMNAKADPIALWNVLFPKADWPEGSADTEQNRSNLLTALQDLKHLIEAGMFVGDLQVLPSAEDGALYIIDPEDSEEHSINPWSYEKPAIIEGLTALISELSDSVSGRPWMLEAVPSTCFKAGKATEILRV